MRPPTWWMTLGSARDDAAEAIMSCRGRRASSCRLTSLLMSCGGGLAGAAGYTRRRGGGGVHGARCAHHASQLCAQRGRRRPGWLNPVMGTRTWLPSTVSTTSGCPAAARSLLRNGQPASWPDTTPVMRSRMVPRRSLTTCARNNVNHDGCRSPQRGSEGALARPSWIAVHAAPGLRKSPRGLGGIDGLTHCDGLLMHAWPMRTS